MWRKRLKDIKVEKYGENRIIGLNLSTSHGKLLVINTYLPCSSTANRDELLRLLGLLNAIIHDSDTNLVLVSGDMNANLQCTGDENQNNLFGKELLEYCDRENLCLSDYTLLPRNSDIFTFVNAANGAVSWLDHVITTKDAHSLIHKIEILRSFVSSDHLPIITHMNIKENIHANGRGKTKSTPTKSVKWDKLREDDLKRYTRKTEETLREVNIDRDLLCCKDVGCINEDHRVCIDNLYASITSSLKEGAEVVSAQDKKKYTTVPGWNEICKKLHSEARQAFLTWIYNGKPRTGFNFVEMKRTRARFKLALRSCKADRERNVADSLASNLLRCDSKKFWEEMKKINDNRSPTAEAIDGVRGDDEICGMWKNHFKNL
jgi:hypothetical protein